MILNGYKKDIRPIKKRAKIGCLSSILIIIFLILIGCIYLYYELNIKETTILTSDSPNHSYQIEIKVKGENDLFDNAPIRIYYGKKGNLDKYKEYRIENDGKILDSENFIIHWDSDGHITIVLIGEEQENKTVKLNVFQ